MSERGRSHKAYPPDFKSKCARGFPDGDETPSQAASCSGIAPSPPSKREPQALENMDAVFGAEAERRREAEAERARQEEAGSLDRIVGRLTVERDRLQREVGKAIGTSKG